ncbi:hypothetical protein R3X26_16345 [Vibrio sp. TH_r3]|uniref:hypothetical protein n=1 Tax=Vibrio sp. TH_r3 TaxID=3082084 RepID=UPI002952FBBD|nr:hypothetical protein [Vibrio sp. TH_r3]MDV7105978.1 hypothetical protein [Vibrio sp. TH_r3]
MSPLGNAAGIAHVTFDVGNGERYESDVLLPNIDDVKNSMTEQDQLIYQSLHSVTMLTELQNIEESTVPVTKLVTYGLTLHSQLLDSSQDLYRFTLEYMGQPTLLSSTDVNTIVFKGSPEDIIYQVNFTLERDVPVCNQVTKTIVKNDSFTSTLCINLK